MAYGPPWNPLSIYIDPDDWLQIPAGVKRYLRTYAVEEEIDQDCWIRFQFRRADQHHFNAALLSLVKLDVRIIKETFAPGLRGMS